MKYYFIKEVEEITKLSERTILRKFKAYQTDTTDTTDKIKIFVSDSNGIKRVKYSETFVNSILNNVQTRPTDTTDTNRSDINDELTKEYIQHLKEEIAFLRSENNDLHEEFKNFQAIKLQAIERIKEQNHIIMQLQTIAEERQNKLEQFYKQDIKEDTKFNFDVEEAEEVQEPQPEEVPKEPRTFTDYLKATKRS